MNMQTTVQDLFKILQEVCIDVEPMGEPDEDGAAWYCEMENDIHCLVSCESNSEDIDIPTISIAISLRDISEFERDDLLKILDINGSFWRANLTASKIDEKWILFLQYKVMVEVFEMKASEFIGCVENLLSQHEMFMS